MGEGWFFKVKIFHPEELEDLMDANAYNAQEG
jgi:glycine cleavage system H lipoate-binding protein